MNKTRTLAMEYDAYIPTEIGKNMTECREKKSSVGQFTKPVSFPHGENEQYLCLPQFMTTIDGEKVALEIKKTTSVNEEDNNDSPYYPHYTLDTSKECLNTRFLDQTYIITATSKIPRKFGGFNQACVIKIIC